jgi:Carboxypeptidase regulatory-like domain
MIAPSLALVLALALPSPQAPSASQAGVRTSAPPAPSGDATTGSITGHIYAGDTGAPLRHASVRAIARGGRDWAQAGTDDQGRYTINDLSPGQYVVTAGKGGFVSMQFGQSRPLEPVRPVDVAAGRLTEHVDVTLPRGGVLTGRVVDDLGAPVIDVIVSPLRSRYVEGRRQLVPAGRSARTDDRGQYRIFGLSPGQYVVRATWRDSDSEDSGDRSSYAPTYYPGTSDAGSAARLAVQAGQEIANVDFGLLAVPVATLTGFAVDSMGRPLRNARLSLRRTAVGASVVVASDARGGTTRQDGRFTMDGVLPGDYTLVARGRGSQDGEIGSAAVSIAGQNVDGVRLTTSRGTILRGVVTIDSQDNPRFDPHSLRVRAVPEQSDDEGFGQNAATLNGNWTFEIDGLTDRAWIRIANLPPDWTLESVRLGGTDVTDVPIDFDGRDTITDLQVTITNRLTDVSGGVIDANGRALTDYVLLVFPVDQALRGYQSRYVKAIRPDASGRFEVRGLPPSDYLAVAVDSIEEGEETDPDLLTQLSRDAVKFSLADGDTKSLTLTVEATP